MNSILRKTAAAALVCSMLLATACGSATVNQPEEPAQPEIIEQIPQEIALPEETQLEVTENTVVETAAEEIVHGSGYICNDEATEKLVHRFTDSMNFEGSVLVAKNFEILYADGFGMADGEGSDPLCADSVYAVGSITKQFTAAAILKLAAEGKLSLDDKLSTFFPDWPQHKDVSLYDLIHMQSGLERDFWNIAYREYGYTSMDQADRFQLTPHKDSELFNLLYADPLHYEPGSEYQYSNLNYWLLSKVIAVVSGMSYNDYLAENFFSVLDMTTAGTDYPDDIIPGHYDAERTEENASLYTGCGSVSASVFDLFKWAKALHGGQVLTEESYDTMTTTGAGYYCCGLVKEGVVLWHNGQLNGYNAYMSYNTFSKILLIVLSNSRTYTFNGEHRDLPAEQLASYLSPLLK